MGVLMTWLLLAPIAQAAPPDAPAITSPSSIPVSNPLVISGTGVTGGTVYVNENACITPITGGAWSCSFDARPIGNYDFMVAQLVEGEWSPPINFALSIVEDPPPPEPEPELPPVPEPELAPVPEPATPEPVITNPDPDLPKQSEPNPEPAAVFAPIAALPAQSAELADDATERPAAEDPVVALPAVVVPELPAPVDAVLEAWNPSEHPKQVLGIGIAAFTIMTMFGPAGLALSSMAGVGVAAAAGAAGAEREAERRSTKGGVKAAKVKSHKFSAEGSGTGDQSLTWRTPGWEKADAWGLAAPIWLATRSPLAARILADGAYVRAMFGSAWLLGVIGGVGLGLAAANQTEGVPIAPSLALTAILLVLAIFDATWGAAGVVGFLAGVLLWPSDLLGLAAGARSFLGLAALWFAIPLIAAASRPFRRSVGSGKAYAWDRLGDTVIATLIAGWAVQKTVGGLPGLSGLDLPIAADGDKLALIAMAAVVARVLAEELAAWRYPLRLSAVTRGKLPFAGSRQRLFATGLRTVLFVFIAIAFLGNCWQLWVGAVLFAVPQVLSIHERKFPNSVRLNTLLPAGILKVLVMLVVGGLLARLVLSVVTDPDNTLRNGFLLLSLPGLALSLIGLFGHDGPDPSWTWRRQILGSVILAVTVGLVLTGW